MTWTNINTRVPRDSIPRSLTFLICINNLDDEFLSNAKLFADDTSLFVVMHNRDGSAANFNNDVAEINHWVHQWKMSFYPGPGKQAQEVIFSRKVNKESYPPLTFINNLAY